MSVSSHPALSKGWHLGVAGGPRCWLGFRWTARGDKHSSAQGTLASCTGEVFSCCCASHPFGLHTLTQDTDFICFQWFLIQERNQTCARTYTEVPWKQTGKLRSQCQSKENYFSALGSNVVVLLFPPLLRAVALMPAPGHPQQGSVPLPEQHSTTATSQSFTSVTSVPHCAFITNYICPEALSGALKSSGQGPCAA